MNKLIAYIGAEKIDSITNGSGISNAVIYMSIYTTIQNEIREYYYKNRESMDQTDVAEKLLCAGRLYTKCIYEEYKNCSFDSEIKDSVQSADNCFRNTLKLLMSYEAKECVGEIDNSDFLNTLTEDYASLVHTPPTIPYLGDVPIFIGCTVSEATEVLGTDYERDYLEGGAALFFENSGFVLALDGEYYQKELTGNEKINYQEVQGSYKLGNNLSVCSTPREVASYQASRGQTMDPLTEDGNFFVYDSWVSDPSGKYAIEFQYESLGSDEPALCVSIYPTWGLEKPSMSEYIGEWTCTNFDSPVELTIHSMDSNSITFDVSWIRLWGIDTVTLPMQNGVATFSDQDMLSGTIIVKNGFVQLKITASDMEYVPTQTFYFAMCGV